MNTAVHNDLLQLLAGRQIPGNGRQKEAWEVLHELGLPTTRNEEYKHTPLTRELEKAFDAEKGFITSGQIPDEKLWKIPDLDSYIIVFLNGRWLEDHSHLPAHARVMPLQTALENHSWAQKNWATLVSFREDAYTAWNTSSWTDGVFIEIPPQLCIDKPLVLYYLHNTGSGQVKSVVRNLIRCCTKSSLTIAEKWFTLGHHPVVSNTVSEVAAEEDAKVNHLVIQNDEGRHYQYVLNQYSQEAGSVVNSHVITLDGTFIRNNTRTALNGKCECHLYGLYLLQGNTFADNHTVVDHRQPDAQSNELYKGILDGKTTGVFNGKIFVRPGAQKTNAFQSNRNLLLSDQAVVHTKPQLEIWADDVKCSHGCTIGQLNEDAQFYLRSRGIDRDTARAMLLYAFAAEIIETVMHEQLKKYLDGLIAERLHKNF
jgi:Fe-S cluster assembly protein SufD